MPARVPGWTRVAVVVLILIGTLIRVRQYVAGRSLWLDEAWVALNVLTHDFGSLTGKLDFEQLAPIPFLWGVKVSTLAFGVNEQAFRLVSLVAGLLVPVVAWRLAAGVLGEFKAVLVLALVATNPVLVYYSNELKPYVWDALAAVVVPWLALRVIRAPDATRGWLALLLGGAFAIICSFTSVLGLAGVGLALLLSGEGLRTTRQRLWTTMCAALWGVVFLVVYTQGMKNGGRSAYMSRYWSGSYLNFREPELARRAGEIFEETLFVNFIGTPQLPNRPLLASLVALLALAGLVVLLRKFPLWVSALVAAPIGGTLAASVLGLYPTSPRTTLFTIPAVCFLMAMAVVGAAPRLRPPVVGLFVALLIGPPIVIAAQRVVGPHKRWHLRPVAEAVQARRRPGEAVYIYPRAIPAWTLYSTDWKHPDSERLRFYRQFSESDGPAFDNAPSRGTIEREGDALVWHAPQGPELLGLSTGSEGRPHLPRKAVVDAGWAQNEVRRMREAAPQVWVVLTYVIDKADGELMAEIQKQGGEIFESVPSDTAIAWHVRFRPTAATPTASP